MLAFPTVILCALVAAVVDVTVVLCGLCPNVATGIAFMNIYILYIGKLLICFIVYITARFAIAYAKIIIKKFFSSLFRCQSIFRKKYKKYKYNK